MNFHVESKTLYELTESIDISFQSLFFGHNSIYATGQYRAATRIFKIELEKGSSGSGYSGRRRNNNIYFLIRFIFMI